LVNGMAGFALYMTHRPFSMSVNNSVSAYFEGSRDRCYQGAAEKSDIH
jgi:hypothetical protein